MKTNAKESQATITAKVISNKKVKIMRFIGMVLIAVIIFTIPAFGSANYGETGGKWILQQVFWVGLIAAAVIVIKYFMAGNYTKMLITGAVAALVLVIVDDPQRLKTVGDAIWSAAGLG